MAQRGQRLSKLHSEVEVSRAEDALGNITLHDLTVSLAVLGENAFLAIESSSRRTTRIRSS